LNSLDAVEAVTADQVRDFARQAFRKEHRIEVATMPRKFVKINPVSAVPAAATTVPSVGH